MDKSYNPKEVEEKIYRLWEKSGYLSPKIDRSKKPFVMALPPPNITGSLHMGHALNGTIGDILIRRKRMEGIPTLWVPGTDHAGIATQYVVEKNLRKEGLSRHDLGRKKFVEKIWEWRDKYGGTIIDQLKKLGCSLDWSRTRFTMDEDYSQTVKAAFVHFYKKGYIYRGKRVINWCYYDQTALSDLENIYEEEKGKLYYIRYPLYQNPKSEIRNPKFIVVATTRPETMLGDTAIAVHPKDARYKNLIGKKVILPLVGREIPIIADHTIDLKFGTGAVKVTPSHSITDFEIAERHKLPAIDVINQFGKMSPVRNPLRQRRGDSRSERFISNGMNENAGRFEGLKILEARAKIVEELESQNLIEKIEDYTHSVGHCARCNHLTENLLSEQWFLKMDKLAQPAIKAVKNGKIKFTPSQWKKVYLDWLENIRDWCLSRQIWWGHRLPIFYCDKKLNVIAIRQLAEKQSIKDRRRPPTLHRSPRDDKYYIFEKTNMGHSIITDENLEKCPIHKIKVVQETDVLDTWFSSALWPIAVFLKENSSNAKLKVKSAKLLNAAKIFGENFITDDLAYFFPTTILSTARDIIHLWVARMVFASLEFTGQIPFSEVYIHPTVFNKEGKRMSKSLGTGVDPIDLIEKYGADAVRFGLAYQNTGTQDIKFSEEAILAGGKFANKIWNSARFVMMQIENSQFAIPASPARFDSARRAGRRNSQLKPITDADKKILNSLTKTIKAVNADLDKFRFGQAAHALYDFYWHDFCDQYLETSKLQLQDPKLRENTQNILSHILLSCLKLLHPFMPYVTEEIYQTLPLTDKKEFLMIETWPE